MKPHGVDVASVSSFPQWVMDQSEALLKKGKTMIPYRLLETVPASVMYSLMPYHWEQVISFFKTHAPHAQSIVDLTAHIGADTFCLAKMYPHAKILAVEKDPDVTHVLQRNIQTLCMTQRIHALCENALHIVKQADLFYIDPPWGENMHTLCLDDQPIETVLQSFLSNGQASFFFVKVPPDFDMTPLYQLSMVHSIEHTCITTPKGKPSYGLVCIKA